MTILLQSFKTVLQNFAMDAPKLPPNDLKKINLPKYLLNKGKGSGRKPRLTTRDSNSMNHPPTPIPCPDGSATPAAIKRRQVMRMNQAINSPTDTFLSPCSQKLWKRPAHAFDAHMGHPSKLDLNSADEDGDVIKVSQPVAKDPENVVPIDSTN